MKTATIALCFVLISCASAQEFAVDTVQSSLSEVEQQPPAETEQQPPAETGQQPPAETGQQPPDETEAYSNVCCSDCSQFLGDELATCQVQCKQDCVVETSCVNSGQLLYAAWCKTACTGEVDTLPVTTEECAQTCVAETTTLCRNGCNDLYPDCNAVAQECLKTAIPKCTVV